MTRPNNLPRGVSSWKPIIGVAQGKNESTLLVPLQWEQGYTDELTLVWMPLPLQLRVSLLQEEGQSIFGEFALFGSNYSRTKDYNWRPAGWLGWKAALNSDLGIESRLTYQAEIKRDSDPAFASTIAIQSGLWIRLSDHFHLYPSASLWIEQGPVRSYYLGEIPTSLHGDEGRGTHLRFPLSLTAIGRLTTWSEVSLETRLYRFGYENEYTEVPLILTLAAYW